MSQRRAARLRGAGYDVSAYDSAHGGVEVTEDPKHKLAMAEADADGEPAS